VGRVRIDNQALTPGQLAKRWGIGVGRVHQLIAEGQLEGVFRIPSAGRYGDAVKIPLATVLRAEREWAVASMQPDRPLPAKRRGARPALKHFPELSADVPQPSAESRGDARS
jgi:hypothetical protein